MEELSKKLIAFPIFLGLIHLFPRTTGRSVKSIFVKLLKKCRFRSVRDLLLPLNLTSKWMLSALAFVISFSIILVSFFIYSGKENLEKELKKRSASLATNLAYSAREPVSSKDYKTLRNYLIGIMNEKEILYSVILDDRDSIVVREDPQRLFTPKIHDFSARALDGTIMEFQTGDGRVFYNIVRPIEAHKVEGQELLVQLEKPISGSGELPAPKKLGTLVLGISLENMTARLNQMRDKAILITLGITLICILSVFVGVEKMTAPIKRLVEATRKIAQGDLSHFVESHRKDELGLLADSFNEMIIQLRRSKNEIKNYTQILEEQVSNRTRELKESEEKYRTLFEHSSTALILIEENEKFSMVNKGFETLSGYSRTEIVGQKDFSSFLDREDWKKLLAYCRERRKAEESNGPINYECTFLDRFGNRKNINLTMSLVPGTKHFLASLADVTELRELQKRVVRAEHLAAIGELSAAIAHEIRNPLGAINTSVGILKNGLNLHGEERDLMEIICEESMWLKKIIDDFLQFAHPNKPNLRDTDVNGLLQETLLLLRDKIGTSIQKQVRLAEHLPLIPADPNQLRQVMINILLNAIEAMPQGGLLTVATRQVQTKSGNHQVEIVFKDTGCGIPEADLKKIFQPFYSTKERGAGMGLAICERIIQNHGGEIKVESRPGKGAQFTIVLPMRV